MHTGRESREQRMSARPMPIEWNETHIGESEMDIIVGTRIDSDKTATLPAVERLARSIATMQAIERIVMTFPEPPTEWNVMEQQLMLIHSLLQTALAEFSAV